MDEAERKERQSLMIGLLKDFRRMFPKTNRATEVALWDRLNKLTTKQLKILNQEKGNKDATQRKTESHLH